jgi:L-2-hydroxyglutarate oxidase LhgO
LSIHASELERRRSAVATEVEDPRKGYGGFPVGGIWLRCDGDAVSHRHHAKVYGKAAVGSPPMSVPHLDAG